MKKFSKHILFLLLALLTVVTMAACNKVDFKISFIVDGEPYHTINTNGSETIKMPADPEKEGYIFDGWYWDKDVWDKPFTANSLLDTPLSESLSVYAKWNDENTLEGTQAKFYGFTEKNTQTYSITVPNATELLNFSDIVEVANKSSWKLTSDIQANNAISSKIATLIAGDNTYYVLVTAQSGDVKLYTLQIRRKPLYLVTFSTSGGTGIIAQNIEEDKFAETPTQPTRAGYTFINWDYDFAEPITAPTTITANWQANTYKIIYHANNGTEDMQEQTAIFDSNINLYDNTTFAKTAYDLVRWNAQADGKGNSYSLEYNFAKYNIADNLELYAVWQPTTYTINYYLVGGTKGTNPNTYTIESETITFNNPIKTDYLFTGWFLESTFENEITEITAGSCGKIDIYARWAATITFDSDGGSSIDSITQNYGTVIIPPENPIKSAYWFIKWQLNGKNYDFDVMPKDNITLKAVWGDFDGGFGTEDNPYIISTAYSLKLFSTQVNLGNKYESMYFVLNSNIDLDEQEWTSIGNGLTYYFSGIFDGNDYIISNFKITSSAYQYVGLFGHNKGTIKNLGIEDFAINTSRSSTTYVGGLVGYNDIGTITNCYAVGDLSATISSSSGYSADAYTYAYVGGLIGDNDGGTITDCYANGDRNVSVSTSSFRYDAYTYAYAGGLIGNNDGGTITNCYAVKDIGVTILSSSNSIASSAYTYAYVGGLVGYNDGTTTDCYAMGDVSASASSSYGSSDSSSGAYAYAYAGGLIGHNYGTITNCYAAGDVGVSASAAYASSSSFGSSYAYAHAGGLAGYNGGIVTGCYATGDISVASVSSKSSAYAYAGGLVGYNYYGTITDCYAIGDIIVTSSSSSFGSSYAYAHAGGLVGYNYYGTIATCYATGDINVTAASSKSSAYAYAGGLVGYNHYGTITICYAAGNISATSSSSSTAYAGGLIGCNSSNGTITDCYATGTVSASSFSSYAYAGGLAGYNGGTLINCYATGDVSATASYSTAYAGGLVGYNSSNATITNCYATADVGASYSSTVYAGGLVGYNSSNATIINCYRYEGQTFYREQHSVEYNTASNTLGTTCSLEQLDSEFFYLDLLEWDDTIWDFNDLDFETNKMPMLKVLEI